MIQTIKRTGMVMMGLLALTMVAHAYSVDTEQQQIGSTMNMEQEIEYKDGTDTDIFKGTVEYIDRQVREDVEDDKEDRITMGEMVVKEDGDRDDNLYMDKQGNRYIITERHITHMGNHIYYRTEGNDLEAVKRNHKNTVRLVEEESLL